MAGVLVTVASRVLGVDPVAGGGGEGHRGLGGRAGGVRGYDQQIYAVAVVAACGQQRGRLAGEVAQPKPAARHGQPAGGRSLGRRSTIPSNAGVTGG
jgi:hypothetical protein